jgi:primosomal protein N' (replication factor Y)
MKYPPLTSLVNLVVKGASLAEAMTDAASLAERLRSRAEAGRYGVLGPAPAPVAKLRGEFRAQVFLKGRQRARMRDAVLAALEAEPDLRRRVTVDVDPLSVL